MTLGYQALHEGAAYVDLSHRGKILVTGKDRARFLHAMTTRRAWSSLASGTDGAQTRKRAEMQRGSDYGNFR